MAYLWSDGFEVDATPASFALSYPSPTTVAGTALAHPSGRFGGKCLRHTGTSSTIFAKGLSPITQDGICGFAFKALKPFPGTVLFAFIHPSGVVVSLTVDPSPNAYETKFRFIIKTGNNGDVIGFTPYISAEQWHYIEIKAQPQNNLLEIRLDEVVIWFSSSVTFAYSSWSGVYFSLSAYAPDGYICLDDLYVVDSSNIIANARDFLGSVTVETLVPVADSGLNDADISPDHSRNDANGQLYILLGGINMEGTAAVPSLPIGLQGPQSGRKIWPIVGVPNFADLQAGLNNTSNSPIYGGSDNLFGPEMTLMQSAQAFDGGTVNIYKLCKPGSALDPALDPGGWSTSISGGLLDVFQYGITAIKAWFSTAHCRVPAIVWGQGEIDGTNESSAVLYYDRLLSLVDSLRTKVATVFGVDNEQVPIVLVDPHSAIPTNLCPYAALIRRAHQRIAADRPKVTVLNPSSVATALNPIYFSSAGYQTLGTLLFNAIQSLRPHSQLVDDLSEPDADKSYVSVTPGDGAFELYRMSSPTRTLRHVIGLMAKVDAKLVSGFGGFQPACSTDGKTPTLMGDPVTVPSPSWNRYHSACPIEPAVRQRAWLPEDTHERFFGISLGG